MKNLKTVFAVLLISSITSITFAKPIKFGLERRKNEAISFLSIQQKLSCYPNLISHWNSEKGFSDKMEFKYGEIGLVRTDIGEPDGLLLVSLKGENVCEIELSLMPDIYYNSKDKLLLIYGYSGSNHFLELFSLKNGCRYIGWASLNSKNDFEEIETNWYQQPDGSKKCQR